MTESIDFKKTYKSFYAPPKKPVIVEVPKFKYLKIDGKGDPNVSPLFQEAIGLLYPLSYAMRFTIKKQCDLAYTVMPLEGLWWADDMATFIGKNKDQWNWTLMIMQPDFITEQMVVKARAEVIRKKKLEKVREVRFEPYQAGLCVTMMHIGSYDNETENIAWMHRFAQEQGYLLDGLHQEIYLSDFRKTAPEKLKTVLRQPVRKAD